MNTIGGQILATLQELAPRLGQPRVRALHVPPAPADGSRRGEFAALELDDGSVGLAYVLLGDTLARLRGGEGSPVTGLTALEVAQAMAGPAGVPRTLAWAAAQALAASLARRSGWAPPPAGDSLAGMAPGPGDHVGLVGLFGPLMPRLVASGARITVIELRPELAGQHDGYEVTLDLAALRNCNKVLATGTLLINDTLDAVLAQVANEDEGTRTNRQGSGHGTESGRGSGRRAAARVALVGPSVGGLPDALFARGVQVLGGTWVEDPAAFVQALATGLERGGSARKFTLAREQWPGWRELLARL